MALGVIDLKNRIRSHLIEFDSLLDPQSREIIEFALKQVESSEKFARRVFGKFQKSSVVSWINDDVYELKHAIGRHIMKLKESSQSEIIGIQTLEQAIHSFTVSMKELEEKSPHELYNFEEEDDDDDKEEEDRNSKTVGLSDQYNRLKESLITVNHRRGPELRLLTLCGMPGIGKTTLAAGIFKDRDILQHFECRVWVRLGRKCRSEEDVAGRLNEISMGSLIEGKRYLIVLDDVWDKYLPTFLKDHFPDEENGSRLLLVSRLQLVGHFMHKFPVETIEMRLMNEEESWDLLREEVFARDELCPFHLEKFGRKIAEKCEGLPLTIIAVAALLSGVDKTAKLWKEVATRKNHQIFKAAYDQISKVLLPSYKRLPRILQICFMLMGVFPPKYEIPRSKLINLWDADGFLDQDLHKGTQLDGMECLDELASNSMVMIYTTTLSGIHGDPKVIKTCGLHSSLWHLSNREATRSKFSHVLDTLNDVGGEAMKMQHRLSFHNNVLFGIKGLNGLVEENCASTAHSVLCYGPYLPYQVPLCFGLRLLRELDALTIRFYEFPVEVLELVELRYLALTSNRDIPPTISKLLNLQFLIVHPHIRLCKDEGDECSSSLPMEIWNMEELQHIQVVGKDLPNPCGAHLPSLLKLSGVSPNGCTEEVFRAIPNLGKLRIRVELSPDHESLLACISPHVSCFPKLTSIKCVVVNPYNMPIAAPLSPGFPLSLARLTLSGLGCAWEEMSIIASLRWLQVLKLRNYAFRGPEWETGEEEFPSPWGTGKEDFPSLAFLVIEDTDLVKWKIGHGSLPRLECLIVTRCYKLREVEGCFGGFLKEVEIVDCNPLGEEQMRGAIRKDEVREEVKVSCCSWFDHKKLK